MFRITPHRFRGFARSTFATALAIFSFSLHAHAKCAGTDILPKFNRTYPEIMQQVRKDADNIANTEAIFWRVEKSGHKASHLFGTMHVTDKRITDMSPEAQNALRRSGLVALEIANMSPTAMMQAAAKVPHLMVYADGSSLSKKLPAEEFDKVAGLLGEAGVPKQMAAVMRPWMISTMLAVPLCEQQRSAAGEIALDLRIEQTAAKNKIPVVGLETIEAQLKSMAGVADADQLAMLRASLAFADQREDLFETLIQAYLKRDLGVVLTLSKALSQIAGLKSSGFAGFSRALIKKRNQSMFDTSLPLVDKGNAFIAVGAAHLIGDNGLVALYRKAGFTVTAIN